MKNKPQSGGQEYKEEDEKVRRATGNLSWKDEIEGVRTKDGTAGHTGEHITKHQHAKMCTRFN